MKCKPTKIATLLLGALLFGGTGFATAANDTQAKSNSNQAANAQIPWYYIAIHNEPPVGKDTVADFYPVLKRFIAKADSYNIKLTLMFSAPWVDYINQNAQRKAEFASWKAKGHEIALHHHSYYHAGVWDGYSNLPAAEVNALRERTRRIPGQYQGTLYDLMQKIWQLDPSIKSGCVNDELNRVNLPDAIIYDTCLGYANHGPVGQTGIDPQAKNGINEYVSTGVYNGIQRKWLTHHFMGTSNSEAKAQFNKLDTGVYGVVSHSGDREASTLLGYLEFLHSADPTGSKSRTLTEIIEQKLLPEKTLSREKIYAVNETAINAIQGGQPPGPPPGGQPPGGLPPGGMPPGGQPPGCLPPLPPGPPPMGMPPLPPGGFPPGPPPGCPPMGQPPIKKPPVKKPPMKKPPVTRPPVVKPPVGLPPLPPGRPPMGLPPLPPGPPPVGLPPLPPGPPPVGLQPQPPGPPPMAPPPFGPPPFPPR